MNSELKRIRHLFPCVVVAALLIISRSSWAAFELEQTIKLDQPSVGRIATDGTIVAVTQRLPTGKGTQVACFRSNGNEWTLVANIQPPKSYSELGHRLAFSTHHLFITTRLTLNEKSENRIIAIPKSNLSWDNAIQIRDPYVNEKMHDSKFASSISADGKWLVANARYADGPSNVLVWKSTADGIEFFDRIAQPSVSRPHFHVIVDANGVLVFGSVQEAYIYEFNEGAWRRSRTLGFDLDGSRSNQSFAASQKTLAVSLETPVVQLYSRSTDGWSIEGSIRNQELDIIESKPYNLSQVRMRDDILLVYGPDAKTNSDLRLTIFERIDDAWRHTRSILVPHAGPTPGPGGSWHVNEASVAIDGDIIAASADRQKTVSIFRRIAKLP